MARIQAVELLGMDDCPLLSDLPGYQYPRLADRPNYIRLFTLLPQQSGNPNIIEGTITVNDFANSKYDALSYEWGSPENGRYVAIDNCRFFVRENLWQALFHLRLGQPRTIWIDAICINQDDLKERNYQVSRMRDIYSLAAVVHIWLGLGVGPSAGAIPALEIINHREKWPAQFPRIEISDAELSEGDDPLKIWHPLTSLFRQSYWKRMWIVQEVCLAKELRIHCGSHSSSWKDYLDLYNFLDSDLNGSTYSSMIDTLLDTIAYQITHWQRLRGTSHLEFSEILSTCYRSLCQDPRDKVFGLLGLFGDRKHGPLALQADYTKSLFEVYQDLVHFEHYRFSHIHLDQEVPKTLENDRPDTSLIGFSQSHIEHFSYGSLDSPFDVAAIERLALQGSTTEPLMRVVGFCYSTIVSMGPTIQEANQSPNLLIDWIQNIHDLPLFRDRDFEFTAYKKALELLDNFNPSRGLENMPYNRRKVIPISSSSAKVVFATPMGGHSDLPFQNEGKEIDSHDDERSENDIYSASNKEENHTGGNPCLFTTSLGDVGIAMSNARTGDHICTFSLTKDIIAILRFGTDDGIRRGKLVCRGFDRTGGSSSRQHEDKLDHPIGADPIFKNVALYLDAATLFLLTYSNPLFNRDHQF